MWGDTWSEEKEESAWRGKWEEHMRGGMGGILYLLQYMYLNVPVNLWYDF